MKSLRLINFARLRWDGKVRRLPHLCLFASAVAVAWGGQDAGRGFEHSVKPFITQYCVACHSGKSPAGGFDLKSYNTLGDVVADLPRWNNVSGRLKASEMPPKAMPQPSAEAKAEIISWIQEVRWSEARKNAGDPGLVLARRLSNAEYNYTIRDLTGMDLRPTREFPVDPANAAGFDNSGETLEMSPALLNKYLQAAREVGDHMVLTPDEIQFSPYTSLVETDREKYAIQRIVDFYQRQPTDYAAYFEAAWRYKHRAALAMPRATLESVALQSKVSPRYLPVVWRMLGETQDRTLVDAGPVKKLRTMWLALPEEDKAGRVPADCAAMRDFVLRIRKDTGMQYRAPVVKGLTPTSQPLMNWKLRMFAAHRREFDPKSLRLSTDAPLSASTVPKYAGLGQEAADRWAVLVAKSRADDPDLAIPQPERARYEKAFAQFANVFPDAFYIRERGRFFPDDSADKGRLLSAGYHNVMGYFRDDIPLQELILDEAQRRELNRLWDEFDFVGDYTERTWVQYYFNQSGEVAGHGRESGSARPSDKHISAAEVIFGLRDEYLKKAEASHNAIAAEAIRYHFAKVNETLRALEKERAAAEAQHVESLLKFAQRAYRRPLTAAEREDLTLYYRSLREKSALTHEEAVRDCVVSVLMSPKFMYMVGAASERGLPLRLTSPNAGAATSASWAPLTDYALASRLSYFLWSSMPDDELLQQAARGELHKPQVLQAQVQRMLKDQRSFDMAAEFGGNWLGSRRFEDYNSVDRGRFPMFTNDLRTAMYAEPVHFLANMMENDRPILDLVYGDYTFVNPVLAQFYGMPPVEGGVDHWVRVDDATKYGRGGLLPMAVFMTMNSPGLRTSPVKRGSWLVRRVIGDEIPAPPPNVPQLPSDEAKSDLPVRQMLEKHRSVPFCASCHARFDYFGLAYEGYGPVGERRESDLAGRPVDTAVGFPGGFQGSGLDGVKTYIRDRRESDVVDNFSRRLLSYALERSLMLSDEPLVAQIHEKLQTNNYRFSVLVDMIVNSPQFLNKRVAQERVQRGG